MPTTMARGETPVSAVAPKKDKNSGWMSHPTEDKLAKTLAGILSVDGIVGIGSLLLYGGKKLFGLSGNEIKHEERDRSTATSVPEGMPNDQLAELANLQAPNEQWDTNLEKVESIVVSLIQTPVQDYTDLVKDISSDDLESYAKQGLKLWCANTNEHYVEYERSIKDTDTWNANYGLLVKIRWTVWLLLIKEKKVENDILTENVNSRHFDRTFFNGDSKRLAWCEYSDRLDDLATLTNPSCPCFFLRPCISHPIGNVQYAIWSLTGDLPEEDPTGRYKELKRNMEKIATDTLPACMEFIRKARNTDFADLF